MINPHFLNALEYQINNDIDKLNNSELEGFFCEGLMSADEQNSYNKKEIEKTKLVMLEAYLGSEKITRYDVVLRFGPQALTCLQQDLDLTSSIPEQLDHSSLRITPEEALMEIQLQ